MIQIRIQIEIDQCRAPGHVVTAQDGNPRPMSLILEETVSNVHVQTGVGEIGNEQVELAVAVHITHLRPHGPPRITVRPVRHVGQQGILDKLPVALVLEEVVLHGVVGHKQVPPTVFVEVDDANTHRVAGIIRQARLLRHVLETVRIRCCDTADSTDLCRPSDLETPRRVEIRNVVQVVADKQVEQRITVHVQKRAPHTEMVVIDTQPGCHVLPRPVRSVPVQTIGSVVRDVQSRAVRRCRNRPRSLPYRSRPAGCPLAK